MAKKTKGKGGKKPKPMYVTVLAVLGLLCAGPVLAQDATPTFGCGGGTCSIYVLDVSWPPAIGINAVEFARFRLGVGVGGIAQEASLSPLGGICLIPRVGEAMGPACQPVSIGG